MAKAETRKLSIDEVVEAAAQGVLRALDARAEARGESGAKGMTTEGLVKAGFFVHLTIRAGGIDHWESLGESAKSQ
jgi:hypothetical protein